jgi:hypothetical protein
MSSLQRQAGIARHKGCINPGMFSEEAGDPGEKERMSMSPNLKIAEVILYFPRGRLEEWR